ncbi:hypothetical protein EVAR_68680_1 [Eumeta japonica]|uniref:Uncharacterized protein n=1 Tax=Eumeta variegata TaxID=151549 RepID=A0A4C2AAS6_EUMVA|nr:hypothetical protein EVAR_68680_1 [Eumeta japonica]
MEHQLLVSAIESPREGVFSGEECHITRRLGRAAGYLSSEKNFTSYTQRKKKQSSRALSSKIGAGSDNGRRLTLTRTETSRKAQGSSTINMKRNDCGRSLDHGDDGPFIVTATSRVSGLLPKCPAKVAGLSGYYGDLATLPARKKNDLDTRTGTDARTSADTWSGTDICLDTDTWSGTDICTDRDTWSGTDIRTHGHGTDICTGTDTWSGTDICLDTDTWSGTDICQIRTHVRYGHMVGYDIRTDTDTWSGTDICTDRTHARSRRGHVIFKARISEERVLVETMTLLGSVES